MIKARTIFLRSFFESDNFVEVFEIMESNSIQASQLLGLCVRLFSSNRQKWHSLIDTPHNILLCQNESIVQIENRLVLILFIREP